MAKKLHYDKDALIKEYQKTFKGMLILSATVIAFALIYFFIMSTYLGAEGHTKHKPYFDRFVKSERIYGNYDGLKLKSYETLGGEGNTEYYKAKPHVKGEVRH
ncbi:MAG: hypothetical protein ACI9TY_001570 [Alphaproteobacteria bacterium]|jgi:hypothetical protein